MQNERRKNEANFVTFHPSPLATPTQLGNFYDAICNLDLVKRILLIS